MKILKVSSILFAVFLLLMGCTAQNQKTDLHQLWNLESLSGFDSTAIPAGEAYIDLTPSKAPKNQYGGKMGCNRLFFTAVFDGKGGVKFSDVGGTMMFCENNELENLFGQTLPGYPSYKVQGDRLILSNAGGAQMIFKAANTQ